MFLLSLYRWFANHPPFLVTAIVIYVFSIRQILENVQDCPSLARETLPDWRFGYSPQQLNRLYEVWGMDGREAYVKVANTDLFPYIEAYTLLLGAFLVVASQRFHWKHDRVAYLAVMVMLMDVGETLIQRHGSQVYPKRLSTRLIRLGSFCNRAKWILLLSSVTVVLSSILFGSASQRRILDDCSKQRRSRAWASTALAAPTDMDKMDRQGSGERIVIVGMDRLKDD